MHYGSIHKRQYAFPHLFVMCMVRFLSLTFLGQFFFFMYCYHEIFFTSIYIYRFTLNLYENLQMRLSVEFMIDDNNNNYTLKMRNQASNTSKITRKYLFFPFFRNFLRLNATQRSDERHFNQLTKHCNSFHI